MFKKILITLFLTTGVCFAGDVCSILSNRSPVFFDRTRDPDIILRIWSGNKGEIVYQSEVAFVTFTCNNNNISIAWRTTSFSGQIQGVLGLTGMGGGMIINVSSGHFNQRPLPFQTLMSRTYGGI